MTAKSIRAGALTVQVYETRAAMGAAAAQEAAGRLHAVIADKGRAAVVFAAAPSQNEFLAHLKKADVNWRQVTAYHMDEYIGLSPEAPQGFGNFLRRAVLNDLPFAAVHLIDGNRGDSAAVCREYAALLEADPPDIVFYGVGENGHLAFNDPAVADFNDPLTVKVVKLDDTCRMQQVNDGCFAKLSEVPTHAITLTVPVLVKIPCAIAIVPGKTKASAIEKTVNAEIGVACPSTILRTHPNAVLFTDSEAASLLSYGKDEKGEQ